MTAKYARPELEGPLSRIDALAANAIESLRRVGTGSPAWVAAIDAALRTHRAPKKLLRAQLVLLGSLAGGGEHDGPALERFAAGVEMLHLFMLVHDDVMDHSTLRRGEPAMHVALRNVPRPVPLLADGPVSVRGLGWETARDMAVVVGSAIAMLGMQYVTPAAGSRAGASRAFELIVDSCLHAGAGQVRDLEGQDAIRDQAAMRRELADKTAYVSFGAPFAAGLLLGAPDGADPAQALIWGEHTGVAFQALDDLGDLVVSPAESGKDALRDLLEGRPSLPLSILRERATGADREFLASLIGRTVVEPGERVRLGALVEASGVLPACEEWIRNEVAGAARVADKAGFSARAREGMAAIEKTIVENLAKVMKAAHDAG